MNGYIDIKITVTDAQGVVLLETDTQKRHAELLEKGNLAMAKELIPRHLSFHVDSEVERLQRSGNLSE